MNDYRVLLFHKQKTSARTLFLKHGHGSVCTFGAFAEPAELLEEGAPPGCVIPHPAALCREVEGRLGLNEGDLEMEPEFEAEVSFGQHQAPVYLLRMTHEDPPWDEVSTWGARFIAITDARGQPVVELELLRRAYEAVLG